jgi:hypothetical protein
MNKNDLKKLEFEFIYFETRTNPTVLRFENITISITHKGHQVTVFGIKARPSAKQTENNFS